MDAARKSSLRDNSDAVNLASYKGDLDTQLMCRVKAGDLFSYGLLVERQRKPLILFLQRIVRNAFVAEELSQEVFLRVYRARASYEPTAKFTTWLFRIGSHLAINNLRDRRSDRYRASLDGAEGRTLHRCLFDQNPTIEEALLAGVKAQEIREAIERLPANQRAAVILHKYREFDYVRIAGRLQCSESAVKSLLFRAYENLRLRLAHLQRTKSQKAA